MLSKPVQLRVMTVAFSLAAQDRARQERFPPQGDQSLWIKVARMNGP